MDIFPGISGHFHLLNDKSEDGTHKNGLRVTQQADNMSGFMFQSLSFLYFGVATVIVP